MKITDIIEKEGKFWNVLETNNVVKERVAKNIEKEKVEHKLRPAIMNGVKKDLENLKPIIQRLYDENIFYLDYWETECPYHGWDWSEDDGSMKSMAYICDEISNKFEEIYALILIGLGEDIKEDKDDKTSNSL